MTEDGIRLRHLIADLLGESLPGETINDRWERTAAAFHRDTGFLRPGKSEPAEMGHSAEHDRERQAAWQQWRAARNDRLLESAKAEVAKLPMAVRPDDVENS